MGDFPTNRKCEKLEKTMQESYSTRLSVNINKIATLRNARGGNLPDPILAAERILFDYNAEGITVHPRPDERHITYADVYALAKLVATESAQARGIEFNIEGNPIPAFMELVSAVVPTQVTLVPDAPDAITSNAGWDTIRNADFLKEVVQHFHAKGIRVSIFVDPVTEFVEGAAKVGADRVELYTEAYARNYASDRELAIRPYVYAAECAKTLGLGLNAGHDLNRENLPYLLARLPHVAEVSIGHALICDALYMGLEQTVKEYLAIAHKNERLQRFELPF